MRLFRLEMTLLMGLSFEFTITVLFSWIHLWLGQDLIQYLPYAEWEWSCKTMPTQPGISLATRQPQFDILACMGMGSAWNDYMCSTKYRFNPLTLTWGVILKTKEIIWIDNCLTVPFLSSHNALVATYLEVYVVDSVSDVFAPVTDFVLLEGGPPALGEAVLTAEGLGQGRGLQREQLGSGLLTPGADDVTSGSAGLVWRWWCAAIWEIENKSELNNYVYIGYIATEVLIFHAQIWTWQTP